MTKTYSRLITLFTTYSRLRLIQDLLIKKDQITKLSLNALTTYKAVTNNLSAYSPCATNYVNNVGQREYGLCSTIVLYSKDHAGVGVACNRKKYPPKPASILPFDDMVLVR